MDANTYMHTYIHTYVYTYIHYSGLDDDREWQALKTLNHPHIVAAKDDKIYRE
jgi:hypothetical protein